jgi:inner membrane protein
MGLADAPRFSVPMPFNTVLWRVVAMTPGGYVEGFHSLAANAGPGRVNEDPSEILTRGRARRLPAVQRLGWFNHGFMGARVRDDVLVLSDLRMGSEPDYVFRFAVARRDVDGWQAIPAVALPLERDVRTLLDATWRRIRDPSVSAPGHPPADEVGT